MRRRIRARLAAEKFDALICEETNLLVNCPDTLPVPLIVDNHNVEHVLFQRCIAHTRNPVQRLYVSAEARNLRRWELWACCRADVVLTCSEHDRTEFAALCPTTPGVVAPNVLDPADFTPTTEGEPGTIVFSGGMDWYPNRDAVQYFARDILPRLQRLVKFRVTLVVAGRSPSPEFRRKFTSVSGISFTGTVADIRSQIARGQVCVVPLRIGSGTRLKILEAAAMAKPIVSTSIGAEGLSFIEEKEIHLRDTADAFAHAVAELLQDPSRREAIGRAARARLLVDYSPEVLRTAVRRSLEYLHCSLSE